MNLPNFLKGFFSQFREFYIGLTPARRAGIAISFVILLTTITFTGFFLAKKTYVPLFKNVPGDQIGMVLTKLREKNIPFQLRDDGGTVAIPAEFVPATQMAIMSEAGSSKIGQIGFELFDKQDFGTTSYVQKINYQRALQGELVRAIGTLDVVKQAKVMLALPAKKTFLEEGGEPKASVVVDLIPGKMLSQDQVRGIMFLVSNAVEGMQVDNVSVVDSHGKMLNKAHGAGDSGLSSELVDMKQRTEAQFEDRIESILTKVVGSGKVIARVDAALDLRNITAVEETVDGDKTAIRSTQSEEEHMNGDRTNPIGVPGSRSNLPGAQDAGTVGFKQDVNKETKVTNYDVPKTVKNIREAPGRIERVSIAVLVDGSFVDTPKEDGTVDHKWVARSPEELAKYEALVKNAIGFSEKRGDTIKIENIQFKAEDFEEAQNYLGKLERRKLVSYLVKWMVIGLSLALFFLLVIRPFMRWITESFHESVDDLLPRTIEELEELQRLDSTLPGMSSALPTLEDSIDPDKAEGGLLRDRILALIEKDNIKAANALSLWLVRRDQ